MGNASDDPPITDSSFQQELANFDSALKEAGITCSQMHVALHSIDAHGYGLAEFTIEYLGPSVIGIVTAAVTRWFAGRTGRKARLKFGDVEAEARTPEEVQQLLRSAATFHAQVEQQGKEE